MCPIRSGVCSEYYGVFSKSWCVKTSHYINLATVYLDIKKAPLRGLGVSAEAAVWLKGNEVLNTVLLSGELC